MATLKGKEAEEYLRKNPKAKYEVLKGSVSQDLMPTEPGFFAKIIKGLTDPFAKLGESANVLTSKGLSKAFGGAGMSNYRPEELSSYTSDQFAQAEKNPYLTGLKGAAGLASYAIPAGAGTKGLLKTGAISGALGGAGTSEGTDIMSILSGAGKGALGGAAVGGTLGAVGSALSKIAGKKIPGIPTIGDEIFGFGGGKAGNTLRRSVFKTTPAQAGLKPNVLAQAQDDMINAYRGISGKTVFGIDDIANSSDDIIRSVSSKIDDVAQGVELPAGSGQRIKNEILEKFGPEKLAKLRKAGESASTQNINLAIDAINGLPDNPTALQVMNAKRAIDRAGGGFSGLMDSKSAGTKEALKELRNVFRSNIPDEIGGLLQRESAMIDLTEQLIKDASKTSSIGAGAIKVPLNVRPMSNRLATGVAGIPDAIGGGAGFLSDLGGKLPSATPTILSSLAGQSMAGPQQMEDTPTSMDSGLNLETLGASSADPARERALLMLELINGGMKTGEAETLSEILMMAKYGGSGSSEGAGKPPTQAQVNANSAIASLDYMDQLLAQGGTGLLVKGKLPFNAGSKEAQIYESATDNVIDILARMRTGAVISPEEEKMYRRFIPKITDTGETRQYKMQQLRSIFSGLASAPDSGSGMQDQDLIQMLAQQ